MDEVSKYQLFGFLGRKTLYNPMHMGVCRQF